MAVPTLTANSPSAGFIAWGAFTIQYGGVAYSVPASNTNATYVGWLYNGGSPLLVTNNNAPILSGTANGTSAQWAGTTPVLGPDDLLLFVNRSGVPINVQAAQLVDGDMIVNGTITSANIATGTITATNIAGSTITGSLIATDTLLATNIAANAIGTSELSSSAVIADKIAAGAITAEKLTIGSLGDNMIKNSGVEDASQANAALPANWSTAFETAGAAPTYLWAAGIVGNKSLGITNSTTAGGAWGSDSFPVTPGQNLVVSVLMKASATTGTSGYIRVVFGTAQTMTRNTSIIATTPAVPANVQWLNTGTGVVTTAVGGAGTAYAEIVGSWILPTTNVVQVSGSCVVPAGASWAIVGLYNWAGTATSTLYFDEINVNDVILSARIANGAITANNIMANTINTGQLNATAINGMTITSNTINSATINSAVVNSTTINGGTIQTASGLTPGGGTTGVKISSSAQNEIDFYSGSSGEGTVAKFLVNNTANQMGLNLNGIQAVSGGYAGGSFPKIPYVSLVTALNNTAFSDGSAAAATLAVQNGNLIEVTDLHVLVAGNKINLQGSVTLSGNVDAAYYRVGQSIIGTSETTASTASYANLATVGPQVGNGTGSPANIITVPTCGAIKITFSAECSNNTAGGQCRISVLCQDITNASATVFTASDAESALWTSSTASAAGRAAHVFVLGGLTAGHSILTSMQYKVSTGTGTFLRRVLLVEPCI